MRKYKQEDMRYNTHEPGCRTDITTPVDRSAVDEALMWDAVEEGLGVGRTELEVGDDIGLADQDGESLKACRGTSGLAMNRD